MTQKKDKPTKKKIAKRPSREEEIAYFQKAAVLDIAVRTLFERRKI
ncbi:MAG: hypothetical protein KDE46_03170 [Caldilineaceae bacterium]|nr:hypothetical protein [Caldilineaceae bacterium]